MTESSLLQEKLKKHRDFLLWSELAGLLHDVGKLSSAFITYRQTWQKMEDGWNKDPHAKDFLDVDQNKGKKVLSKFPELVNFLKALSPSASDIVNNPGAYSLYKMVDDHGKSETDKDWYDPSKLLAMLKAADGRDAAIDRNNPFFTAEKKGDVYNADAYGYEEKVLSK